MAVMTDTQGFVAEGGTESVFCVKDGVLTTPTLGTVLQSISRKSVLEVARASKIETAEKRFDPECLLEADEIFFSCAPQKIWPVRKIENRVIRPVPGPVTQRLTTLLDEICSGRNRHFKNWLFPVR
jgi:branched-chain amino acid aminotransferase